MSGPLVTNGSAAVSSVRGPARDLTPSSSLVLAPTLDPVVEA